MKDDVVNGQASQYVIPAQFGLSGYPTFGDAVAALERALSGEAVGNGPEWFTVPNQPVAIVPDSPALRKKAEHPELVVVALSREDWGNILHQVANAYRWVRQPEWIAIQDAIREQIGGGDA